MANVTRVFSDIDGSANFVVADDFDCFRPSPFWNIDEASDRLNDLWGNGYRPRMYRRLGNGATFEAITK